MAEEYEGNGFFLTSGCRCPGPRWIAWPSPWRAGLQGGCGRELCGFFGERGDPGKDLALKELEAGSAAGGDVGDVGGDAGLLDGRDGVAAADDGGGVAIGRDGLGDGVGAVGEGR